MVLHRVSGSREVGVVGHGFLDVDGIPQTDELDAWFAHAHGPTHALDGDFLDATGEFVMFDLAVVVVVAGIDHGDFFGVEVFDDVGGDEGGQDVLILVACL